MSSKFIVQIVRTEDNYITWQSEALPERLALKTEKGANINLNHLEYYTKIVEVEDLEEYKPTDM